MTVNKNENNLYALTRASRCHNCDQRLETGAIVQLVHKEDDREVLCEKCAGLGAMEFLPSGNAKITTIAKKKSTKTFVVLRWSELWKTYERQGIVVDTSAIDEAESATGIRAKGRKKLAQ